MVLEIVYGGAKVDLCKQLRWRFEMKAEKLLSFTNLLKSKKLLICS
jgi:hypothetical protein